MNRRRSIAVARLLALVFCTACLSSGALLAGSSGSTVRQQDSRLSQIKIQLGPIEVIRGPDRRTDNPFNTLMSASSLLGYVANGFTEGYIGGSLETLRPQDMAHFDLDPSEDLVGAKLELTLTATSYAPEADSPHLLLITELAVTEEVQYHYSRVPPACAWGDENWPDLAIFLPQN